MKPAGHPTRHPARALGLILLACSALARAQNGPRVVELFTSEGCSSCPPAEALLGRLSDSGVIALAWHVGYWDSLGWHDRFALADSDRRQNHYARNLRLPSVYTPQAVIDGRRDAIGSDESAIRRASTAAPGQPSIAVTLDHGQLQVALGAAGGATPCDVQLISYLRAADSRIGGGENVGRTLREFNIVRSLHTLGQWNGSAGVFRVALTSLPSDATDVAVLLQARDQGVIENAVTHPLR